MKSMIENYRPRDYQEQKPRQLRRIVWRAVNRFVFPCVPFALRCCLLRMFGAHVVFNHKIYSSVSIFAPWNLEIVKGSVIGPNVVIYNKDRISIGVSAVVSQDVFLCTASHDVDSSTFELITRPITISKGAWIGARAIILPGVTIGEGAVVGAGSVVTKNVEPWTVVAGNPAKFIKKRVLRDDTNG